MNRAFLPFAKSLFVAMLAVSSIAFAAGPTGTAVAAPEKAKKAVKVDPAKGEVLYTRGDPARNIAACMSCHGAAGNSTIAQNPKLAAQHDTYTFKQLADFKTPARNNPIMTAIAKALTEEEMRNLAAYLNAQAAKPGAAKNKETIELGKQIYRAGLAEKNVPACAGCHGPTGAGIPAQFARLAGQHQEYTAAELVDFRAGARANSPQMTVIAKRLSDEEIKAVSDYIAGLSDLATQKK
jgi:cytochrome c553